MVEYRLAKARVAGSNPVSCSSRMKRKTLKIRLSAIFCVYGLLYTVVYNMFPVDKSRLRIQEEDILNTFYHYCLPLKFDNETDEMIFQSYYGLGAAVIARSIMDSEFLHRDDENLRKFHERYMGHLKKAVDECYSTKKDYERLVEMILKDFEILYRVVKKKSITDFEYFRNNSRMKN